ncbi:hypothetical protein [Achromobacter sp. K91]|uniref:hypothetical protein n=1 Tax=Achromobacter sp. K91 TaxID=2292262 RepID=UPI0011C3C1D6|nr:hypothetical protein [Achromobacter sp. K91]
MDFDWSEIVFDLKRSGMDQSRICAALNRRLTESMIRQYMAGTSAPSHWRGELLLNLWCERTGHAREEAPTRPAHLTHAVRGPRRNRGITNPDALDDLCRQYRLSPVAVMNLLHKAMQRRARARVHTNLTLPGMDTE